ncbi:hypothetical protein KO525_13845 [Psychrosphaera sp. B3R10]|uniref:Uncharacterized protein n=1 Tax=Psychrosphaera algicola TaxID=3023714 RepID=A0ABT5FF61_9GAMM|nr:MULTISPECIES: hypothetical protein [unclassified Psychrosphaera]MBU2883440.1 hypothetical protein [Psychrosphaera sp. I2R16]MBU2990466.1 hypothetical protein [Psychrosphaera sp. B3R10]MDC2889684.1 hypothetical protein [Psychrosphaera sp. G1-22]MDO6719057.1 hypothetical protein [Psychrosphaera sp. 1_MG-2023]
MNFEFLDQEFLNFGPLTDAFILLFSGLIVTLFAKGKLFIKAKDNEAKSNKSMLENIFYLGLLLILVSFIQFFRYFLI